MQISIFSAETDNQPKAQEGNWEDLVKLLTEHTRADDKMGMPAWSPATFTPPIRAKENVRSLCVAAFDLDAPKRDKANQEKPEAFEARCAAWRIKFAEIIERVDKSGYSVVLHSSHSHTPQMPCARLVFRLSRAVLNGEWPAVWSGIPRMLDFPSSNDPKVKDSSRLYFLPCAKPDAPVLAGVTDGTEVVDVDALLSYAQKQKFEAQMEAQQQEGAAPLYQVAPAPGAPIVEGDAISMSAIRERVKHMNHPEVKVWAQRVLKGECLESVGGRDDAIHKLTGAIVFSLPTNVPTAAIMELLRPSLALMDPPETGTWADLAESKIDRARARKVERDGASVIYAADVMRRLMRDSAKTAPKDLGTSPEAIEAAEDAEDAVVGPYTSEQLATWAAEQGCADLTEFERRWVIQDGGAYYVFVEGKYARPIGEKVIETSFQRDLARAPIKLRKATKDGIDSWRSAREILADYSTPARTTVASLCLQRSHYDPAAQAFNEAVCPLRHLRATEHPEIQRWLDLLGGQYASLLTDWVSAVSRVERQSCGLYLDGPAGVGKTLLASGLARLWTTGGPAELANVLGGFNDSLLRCPLVFADEALPKKPGITAEVRRLIGSTSRNLSRKFMPNCSLEGALRVIVAGNNAQLLNTTEQLSSNDLEAFAGRFLYLKAPQEAADYLKSLGGPPVVGRWITSDKLAEHSLHLRSVRELREDGRFLVEGGGRDFLDQLSASSGNAESCCEFLVHYLTDPMTLQRPSPSLLVGEGEIWVNTDALSRDTSWNDRVPSSKVPSATAIGQALSGLSSGSIRAVVGTENRTYYRMRVDLVLAWVVKLQMGDVDAVRRRIAAANSVIAAALIARQ